ncbi:MAG: alginate export family protein [Gammaproteobacteria bacterium]
MKNIRSLVSSCLLLGTSLVGGSATAAPGQLHDAAALPAWLRLDLVHRTRYETLDDQFRAGRSGGDQALSLYTSVRVAAHGGRLRAVAELIDARAYLTDRGGSADSNLVDTAELAQAYLGVRFDALDGAVRSADLVLGRMMFDLGAGRLIGRNLYRNMPNAFTGARLELAGRQADQWTFMYLLPHSRLPLDQASVLDNEVEFDRESFDTQLWGVHYQRKLAFATVAEGFVLGLHERDGDWQHQTQNRELYTVGARFARPRAAGTVDFDIEGGVQTGQARATTSPLDRRDLDVFAGYLHAEVGHTFEHAWSPRVSLQYDYASGDDDPGDGDYGRFDTLYGPVRGDLGPTSLYTHLFRTNLNSPGLRFEVAPTTRVDGMFTWRAVWLDAARDSFGLTGVRDPSGASSTFAGHQIDLRARYWVLPESVRLEAGGALFVNGGFYDSAPNATGAGDSAYGYADITFYF